jgi:hypothetical protein
MVRRLTLRLGEGTRCSVHVKNLRPSREITERILNPLLRQRVTDLVATRRGIITRGRSSYEAIFSRAPPFPTSNSMLQRSIPSLTPRDILTASGRLSNTRTASKRRRPSPTQSEKSTRQSSRRLIILRTSPEFVPRAMRLTMTTRPYLKTGLLLTLPQLKSLSMGFSGVRGGDGMVSTNELIREGTKNHLSRTG